MLAQITNPTAVEIAAYLACTAFVVGLVNQAMKLVDRVKSKPPGEQLQLTTDQLSDRVKTLETLRAGDLDAGEDRRRAIYLRMDSQRDQLAEKIDKVGQQVSGLGATTDLLNQRIAQIDGKLDRAIERMPRKS